MTDQQTPAPDSETPSSAVVLGQGPGGEVYVLATPEADGQDNGDSITEPGRVMRIGRMVSRLLDEVKEADLDDGARERLGRIYAQSLDELVTGLDDPLTEELRRVTAPFADTTTWSDPQLRIAQAQLVGWLEGLFQGLQTALVAQHITARMHEGAHPAVSQPTSEGPTTTSTLGTGMYL